MATKLLIAQLRNLLYRFLINLVGIDNSMIKLSLQGNNLLSPSFFFRIRLLFIISQSIHSPAAPYHCNAHKKGAFLINEEHS